MSLLAEHLFACRTPAELYRLQILIECVAVPTEMGLPKPYIGRLPEEAGNWLSRIYTLMFTQSRIVQPFDRRVIAPHVTLYSARRSADEPRDLLVAFCGLADRLQIPIPVMLQYLDADRYDVLLLRDPTKKIYLEGVPDYAPDLAGVARRIGRDLDLASYGAIRSYGTSGGGWAAMTVGTMLGADRAIAMSANPPGASFRLNRAWKQRGYSTEAEAADFGAFERQFNALPDRRTRLFAFYGADYESDRIGAQAFERLVGAIGIGFRGVNDHNLVLQLLLAARFGTFLDRYLNGDLDLITPPPGERLLDIGSLDIPPAASPGSGEPELASAG